MVKYCFCFIELNKLLKRLELGKKCGFGEAFLGFGAPTTGAAAINNFGFGSKLLDSTKIYAYFFTSLVIEISI